MEKINKELKTNKINFEPWQLLSLVRKARFHCCICENFAHDGEGAHIVSPSPTHQEIIITNEKIM